MPIYKKKPVTIEAKQVLSENLEELIDFVGSDLVISNGKIIIKTLEGLMYADPGDWIIKGVQGEFYPCKPDIFEMTYEFIGPKGYDAPYMVN